MHITCPMETTNLIHIKISYNCLKSLHFPHNLVRIPVHNNSVYLSHSLESVGTTYIDFLKSQISRHLKNVGLYTMN